MSLVYITQEALDELEHDARVLQALRDAGVDNWDGYDYAMGVLNEVHE